MRVPWWRENPRYADWVTVREVADLYRASTKLVREIATQDTQGRPRRRGVEFVHNGYGPLIPILSPERAEHVKRVLSRMAQRGVL